MRGWGGYLIFTTVLREMVFQSFAAGPFDYLVKPIETDCFSRTMERLLASMDGGKGANLLIQRGMESGRGKFFEIPISRLKNREFAQVVLEYMKL